MAVKQRLVSKKTQSRTEHAKPREMNLREVLPQMPKKQKTFCIHFQ